MNNTLDPEPHFPLRSTAVLLLCVAWLLMGVVGHDPWKPDDVLNLGAVWSWQQGTLWPQLMIGGVPWVDEMPAWHSLAWLTAWLTGWWLPFHDAARLASAISGALFLGFVWRAATALYQSEIGRVAPILAMGVIGLLVPIHTAQPILSAMAGAALAYYGLARLPQHALIGVSALGAGVASAFIFGGSSAVTPLLPLLLLPLVAARKWLTLLAIALAVFCSALWLGVLQNTAPEFLAAWWALDRSQLQTHDFSALSLAHLELLAWFSWPLSLLAGWVLWLNRGQWRQWSMLMPLIGFCCALIWYLSSAARVESALPMLPPLILLASAGAHRLRRGAAQALDWFSLVTFSFLIALVWLGAVALWASWPPKIAHNFAKLAPGYIDATPWYSILLALLLTVAWFWLVLRLPRSPWRAVTRWSAGLVVFWGLLVTLMMPWIDYGKSYRTVASALLRALPAKHGCISGSNLGLSQRAALDYHAGLRALPDTANNCRWLLVQSAPTEDKKPKGWVKVWAGQRPGDKNEMLTLYRR